MILNHLSFEEKILLRNNYEKRSNFIIKTYKMKVQFQCYHIFTLIKVKTYILLNGVAKHEPKCADFFLTKIVSKVSDRTRAIVLSISRRIYLLVLVSVCNGYQPCSHKVTRSIGTYDTNFLQI